MQPTRRPAATVAFTKIDLLVILAVVALLAVLGFAMLGRWLPHARRIRCTSHLKQIGISFRQFASDHRGRFPARLPEASNDFPSSASNVSWYFRAISNELAEPSLVRCPADRRRPATNWAALASSNVSYFLGLDADETTPNLLLAGDSNLTTNGVPVAPGLLTVTTNTPLGWTAQRHGLNRANVSLADGSVQSIQAGGIPALLQSAGATNRLAVP